MSDTSTKSRGGIGTAGTLLIVFLVLKLTHLINWPWLWVLSPLWIGGGLSVLALAVVLGVAGIIAWRDR